MRLVLMLISLLIISLLIFKGFPTGLSGGKDNLADVELRTAVDKAAEVNQVIQDAATIQRQELEKQIQ
jgi:hypothetical protein